MPPKFQGDLEYPICATGDVCAGDRVRFERATFTGSRLSPKFAGFEQITAIVLRESYGSEKQQHTFTLLLEDGTETRIKGRNLYRNGVWRQLWSDESRRAIAVQEKHTRGAAARAIARQRQRDQEDCFLR
jgi:hypothetical protein